MLPVMLRIMLTSFRTLSDLGSVIESLDWGFCLELIELYEVCPWDSNKLHFVIFQLELPLTGSLMISIMFHLRSQTFTTPAQTLSY
jgi:hypothetical protein